MDGVFASVSGNEVAVAALRAAASDPVHAYLLVGPRDTGEGAMMRAFAAAVLCPEGGCGHCTTCTRVVRGVHPDAVEVARSGSFYGVDEAREITRLAARRPMEADHQVVMVPDLQLAERAAPALLKTIEEPPSGTIFLLQAEHVPASLRTIASRCVVVPLRACSAAAVAEELANEGIDAEHAAALAAASAGRIGRARVLAADPGALARQALWREVPARLDGSGASVVACAEELVSSLEAATAWLEERQQAEIAELVQQANDAGHKSLPGRAAIEERQHREARRWRSEELHAGLSALAGSYRDELVGARTGAEIAAAARAVSLVHAASAALVRNPNERLMLEALLVNLSRLAVDSARR